MRSSNRQYLFSVDQIRAFAVLLVVFYHGAQLFGSALSGVPYGSGDHWLYSDNPLLAVIYEGHSAVALFMVLSGFIFAIGTLGHEVSYPRFMANRLLRIYPLFVLLIIIGVAANPDAFRLGGFLQLLGGLGNLPGALQLGFVSLMFWAVAVEMQFYLLFPLLNRLFTRFGPLAFGRLLAAIIVVRALVWVTTKNPDVLQMLYLNLAGRIDQFLLGMIAAWLYLSHGERFRGWWKVGVSLVLVVGALWAFNHVHGFVSNSPLRLVWVDIEGFVWALAILTWVTTCRSTNFISRAVAKIGELSYSAYLLHFMVIAMINEKQWWVEIPGLGDNANALVTTTLLLVPLALACSAVTYYGVEQPFLRMRVRYLLPADKVAPSITARPKPGDGTGDSSTGPSAEPSAPPAPSARDNGGGRDATNAVTGARDGAPV